MAFPNPSENSAATQLRGEAVTLQHHSALERLAPALHDELPVLGVVNFNVLDAQIAQVHEIWADDWCRPAVSVATLGLPGILEHARARGLRVQTRNAVELEIARRAGFLPDRITHSAPVTTRTQLAEILAAGVHFGISNFAELTRVDELRDETEPAGATIGVQVTPQASTDDNATEFAHLGIGLRDHREELIAAFVERPWLTQLHVSFDTPPTTLQQAVEQVAAVHRFAEDVEHAAGGQRVTGLHFAAAIPAGASLANHRFIMQAMLPDLTDGKYVCTIDFSTYLTAAAGMILAKVEYTKDLDSRLIAVVHAGALPHPAQTSVAVYDAAGAFKDHFQQYYYDVAGPNGLIAQSVPLPLVEEGDVLAVLDVGATAFGADFSAPVYGIRADGLLTESTILTPGRSLTELVAEAGIFQPKKLLH